MTPEVLDVALSFMEGLDSAHSLTVAILLRYGEWDQLVSKKVDPALFLSPEGYMAAASAVEFLRKFEGLPTSYDLDAITLKKWWWAERECFKTNRRLEPYLNSCLRETSSGTGIEDFILRLRKVVLAIVGYGPPSTYEGRFGPGATVTDRSTATTVADKMSSFPSLTPNALFHLVPWTGTVWAKASAALGRSPVVVRGNEYFTVLKDSTSHRACGKEPSINVFYQLGLGREIRRHLKKVGFDLTLGQDVHRRVACAASIDGESCTIDLTSASDCKSTSLVRLCMPRGWLNHLESLRSPLTRVGDHWVHLEKFSSMGNGFTFELETLLFASICLVAMGATGDIDPISGKPDFGVGKPGKNLFVYGDDIIVPTSFSRVTIAALKWFGFTPNPKKTFLEGNFRESCGGDFFRGVSVRGHNLEKSPNEPQEIISLANGISRVIRQDSVSEYRKLRLRRTWFKVLDLLPSDIRRCRGPEWLGDQVIHDDESRWETRWRGQFRYIKSYRPVNFPEVRWDGFAYDVQFAAALYGVFLHHPRGKPRRTDPYGFDRRVFHSRGDVSGYKVGWLNCP